MQKRSYAHTFLATVACIGLALGVSSAEVKQYRCRICGVKYELTHPLPEPGLDAVTQNELFCASCSKKLIPRTDVAFCGGCGKELFRNKGVPVWRGWPEMLPLEGNYKSDKVRVRTEEGKVILEFKGVKDGEMFRKVHTGNAVYTLSCFRSVLCADCKRKRNLKAVESFAENASEYLGRFIRGLGSGLIKGVKPEE